MRSVGLPASASSINRSSCGSLNARHQSLVGQAAGDVGVPASVFVAASAFGSSSDARVSVRCMSAQPASATEKATDDTTLKRVVISLSLLLHLKPQQHGEHRAARHEKREGNVGHEETELVDGSVKCVRDAIEHGQSPCLRCLFFVGANNA